MKRTICTLIAVAMLVMLVFALALPSFAANENNNNNETTTEATSDISSKAVPAAIVVGLAAAAGAIAMGFAISKSADSIARQPEAESKIRTTLMLGLVFIETAIIYALIVAILIIFVL